MHRLDMILDFQFGSTGKGLIAGYLAKREDYDTAICAFATNAGHTYLDAKRGLNVMTQQLPTAITSPSVKTILLGPGSAIHMETLKQEIARYAECLYGKRILIHPNAAVVEDYHAVQEMADGRTKMGSTGKGVGEAYIERIRRSGDHNTVRNRWKGTWADNFICTEEEYRQALDSAENVIIEGAQGFSLSMYHGFYPFTTSRDVTPWQVAADCGIPFKWANYIKVVGTLRTFPIRVNNRDGSSGPGYSDQAEMTWDALNVDPELTTVTKLPRRVFTFSHDQVRQALWHCGAYWETKLFLNFANYIRNRWLVDELIKEIETPRTGYINAPKVAWIGMGPDDSDIEPRDFWDNV